MKNVAVILAGGNGRRMGTSLPKQFLKIAGKTVIEHTVGVFQSHPSIDEIAIVVNSTYEQLVEAMVIANHWTKVKKILNGGGERYESSLSAIQAYRAEATKEVRLIFHDAVRPLVSSRIIADVCQKLESARAVDVAVPAVDTIINVGQIGKTIEDIPCRSFLRYGQTPQGFHLETISEAYERALQDPEFQVTDDCGVVVKYLPEVEVEVVEGEARNIKLTHPEDFYLLDKLFQLKATMPVETELSGLKNRVLVIFGGSSGIGKDMAALARKFGADVYVFSRTEGAVDVSDRLSVDKALQSVNDKTGCVDFVVNTAAVLCKEPITHHSQQMVRTMIDINYLGAVNTTLAAYPYLQKSRGQILQFTSSSYTRGRADYALYSSTKAAVVNFVQAVAEEWSQDGIRINCINPQRTRTPMRLKAFGLEDESTLLKSEAVAKVALWTLLNRFTGEVVDVRLGESFSL